MIAIKKVGIFGGSFDPIHLGHVHLISELSKRTNFDEFVVVPAGQPWQKNPVASKFDRLEMTKLALQDLPVRISDVEVKRSGNSYAIDTVNELKSEFDPCQIVWIAGSDIVSQLHTWHHIEELAQLVKFLIVKRPNSKIDTTQIPNFINFTEIEIAALDISATQVRSAIAAQGDIGELIPDKVAEFIKSKGLYGAA
ncbi:MAG: nicotinate (nicotinamide) nucleotide adenylyltransferase [Candidatus Nanopelagicaceae bacterium]|nr:nicotinate (nicotinamide) nucleotide adenylyltransferase [Candidatus Nanopelagicaceae bacterium]